MKETPILFNAAMVRAVIAGTKTQTRRALKPQPVLVRCLDSYRVQKKGDLFIGPDLLPTSPVPKLVFALAESAGCTHCMGMKEFCETQSPYGQPGDKLWVREAFAVQPDIWEQHHGAQPLHYLADITDRSEIEDYVGKPSIHMPRWASRLVPVMTEVRVERVQDISEADALAEGITWPDRDGREYRPPIDLTGMSKLRLAANRYSELWDSVSANRLKWADNPWVWAISFLPNLAHTFVNSQGKSVRGTREEYHDACIDFAGDLLDHLKQGKLAYFDTPNNAKWRYHAAVEVDGWIHDLWEDMPWKLDLYMAHIGATEVDYTAEYREGKVVA